MTSTVCLQVLEPNAPGATAYGKAGFRHAGRMRRAGFWQGMPVDELMMDAVPEEFPGHRWSLARKTDNRTSRRLCRPGAR